MEERHTPFNTPTFLRGPTRQALPDRPTRVTTSKPAQFMIEVFGFTRPFREIRRNANYGGRNKADL